MELLKKLSNADGIAAHEDEIRKILIEELKEYVDEIYFDNLGSLIMRIGNSGPKIMVCAHMDEVGFLIKNILDNGAVTLKEVGNINEKDRQNIRVRVTTNNNKKVYGVLNTDFLLDFGVNSKEEVMNLGVNIGDMVCYSTEFKKYDSINIVEGKAFDDRVGCYILAETIKRLKYKKLNCNIHFAFTTCEEVGMRGSKTASNKIKPDISIILDVVSSKNVFSNSTENTRKNGGGILLEVFDKTFIPTPKMLNLFKHYCEINNKKYQLDCMNNGGTDAGEIHKNNEGSHSIVTSLSLRYCHGEHSMINMKDVNDMIDIYEFALTNINSDTLKSLNEFC